jgi:eukaryotic-like serine/threonine-protein kinase
VGEVFAGRYELVDPIGRGGAGSVWRTWDRRSHRYVAAKLLVQSDVVDLVRFMREQSFRIDHRHVLTPLGWAGEDDRVLMTMPIVRGGSVAQLLRDFTPLPPAWVAVLLEQLLAALDAVHGRGLVHRDVKPSNLLLHATGRARPHLLLSDFGIATRIDEPRLTHAAAVLGTAGYVAPEQLAGADPNPVQDLYAAGQVCCELATGIRPDRAGGTTPPLPADPAPLWDLVRALLAADPAERPASARDARERLVTSGVVAEPPRVPADAGLGVEVFDHLPTFPDGWTTEGPVSPAVHPSAQDRPVVPTLAAASPAPAPVGAARRAQRSGVPAARARLRRLARVLAVVGVLALAAGGALFLMAR